MRRHSLLLEFYTEILCLTTCLHAWTCFWRVWVQPFLYPEVPGMMPIDLESGDNQVTFLSPGDLISSIDITVLVHMCVPDHVCIWVTMYASA